MAKKATKPFVAVMAMSEVVKLNQSEAVNLYVEKVSAVGRAFMECAKLMIHIRSTLRTGQTVYGLLKKQGVRESTLNNGAQAERVYNEFVAKGVMKETAFDQLAYMDCVAINAVVKARGVKLATSIIGDLDEIHFVHETGKTTAEAKEAKAAEPKPLATVLPADATVPTTAPETAPATAAKPAVENAEASITVLPPAKPTKEDALHLVSQLELAVAELSGPDLHEVEKALFALTEKVVARCASHGAKNRKAA